jgi:hypothetical protein
MKVSQIYDILNTITSEMLGDSIVVAEDLSNIVDVGKAFENLENGLDNYVRKLQDHIGRVIFVDRVYTGRAPSVLMDGWEYGSILEKVRADLPEAEENETWELEDRASYDPNIFYKPSASVKFFNKRITFEIPISITEKQVKSSFSNVMQLNAFYSMIQTAIQNSMTVKLDALIMRTINAAIGETMYNYNSGGTYTGSGDSRAVNLLYLYNNGPNYGQSAISAAAALTNPDFLRFAVLTIKNYLDWIKDMSDLFNIGGTSKFTAVDRRKCVLLSEFKNATEVYLYNGASQFKTDDLKLPEADVVSYWQGSGTGYAFGDTSKIIIKTPSGHDVTVTGILGVIFDRDTLGVSNVDRRVTTNYNAKAEFWNEWHKYDAGYFLDLDENFVVFYVA